MLIGYARVSRGDDQTTDAQAHALTDAGIERIYTEHASGGRWDRPALHRMIDQLRPGDVVVVTRLDRLSRSLKDLLTLLERIEAAEAGFRSLAENVDTTTPAGRMLASMLGAMAEYERSIIRERTREGVAEARRQGRTGGRPPSLTREQESAAVGMIQRGERTQAAVARLFGVDRSTVSRAVSKARQRPHSAPEQSPDQCPDTADWIHSST
jgi:DNA invertase Pin-like site-specific DNA recombinase